MTTKAKPAVKPSLTIKRHFNARPEKIYAAWTNPEELVKWFGPGDGPVLLAETDLRAGGNYHIVMRSPDGTEHDVRGVYREVVPNEKLVFTWAWLSMPEQKSLVTIQIKPDGAGSLLTLIHDQLLDKAARDLHRKGWVGCLDSLERDLA